MLICSLARRGRRPRARLRRRRRRLPGQAGDPRGAVDPRARAGRRLAAGVARARPRRRRLAGAAPLRRRLPRRARASRSPPPRTARSRSRRRRPSRPALIVSDYEMPVMTGFELVHALRRDPELRQIPVIMLTARDSKRDMAQMRAAGASAYLVKPFAQDKCIALVERTLAERRLMAYKEASSLFISEGARAAAEERAAARRHCSRSAPTSASHGVMFSDLVGFTPMSATLTPRELIDAAQRLLRRDVPDRRSRTAATSTSSSATRSWRSSTSVRGQPPPAERAVRAALAMQAAMPAFNAGRGIQLDDAHRHQHRPARARRPRLARRAPRLHRDRRHREPGQPLRGEVPARRGAGLGSRRATCSATARGVARGARARAQGRRRAGDRLRRRGDRAEEATT